MGIYKIGHVLRLTLISLMFLGLFYTPLLSTIQSASAATQVLTPKWTRTELGTNWEGGLVIGDVTGDGIEDVVFAGGNLDIVYVLNGNDGSTIATYTNTRIGQYCQPQLYDVDGDDILDILVPLYSRPGLAVVKYVGTANLSLLWLVNTQGATGSGSVMAKPVAGDIDGDEHLDIFIASQDVSPLGGYDGTIVRINYLGQILATNFAWRACSGGLSLADTDNDGVFEIYQGDRQMGYTDGGYGKGAKSLWADNLTERWNRLDFISSSQAPVLVDVNGDGILDIVTGMSHDMNMLNSSNGERIRYISDSRISVHYGITVYDIDRDGRLELLCDDGDHDNDPYTDVFDLVTGQMDAQLSLAGGDWKWSPLVADIDPTTPGMEIISCPNGTTIDNPNQTYWFGLIMIWNNDYELLQNVSRDSNGNHLGSQLAYPIVQDIDNDGLLELVTHSSYPGNVYVFDTIAPAPGHNEALLPGTERIRSDVTFYGECRLGVAEHTRMPGEANYWTAPLVAPVSPSDNALAISQSTSQLLFKLRDDQSNALTYSVTTSPNIGSRSGSISSDTSSNWNTISVDVSSLAYDTTYRWTVTVSDGSHVTARTYTFRTALAPVVGNSPPNQGDPSLVLVNGTGSITSTFETTAQSTSDPNGDSVANLYRWTINGDSVAQLLLPFDTRGGTSTTDYSSFGNNGVVKGATWVPNGIVGGAYSFDGKDDAIIISDGGAGYFNGANASSNHEELGGFGNWNGVTVEAWIYLTQNNLGSRIVAKVPSYALGFQSGSTNRLSASVWPMGFEIADDENQASTDRERSVSASSGTTLQLNSWYHVAFSYERGVGLKLYLNGQLIAQSSVSGGPVKISRGEPLYIGRLVQPFAGMIDEVRLYNYAVPAEQINNRYLESRDGNSNSSTFLLSGYAAGGDLLGCDVIPTDSYEEGTIRSASTNLLNTPPVASNLNIYPLRSRPFCLDTEDLIGGYHFSDFDGNVDSGSMIRWYLNDVLQSGFNDSLIIHTVNTSAGQTWSFTVVPCDSGGAFGDLQTSGTITIWNNSAPTTDIPTLAFIDEDLEYDDEDILGTAVATTDGNGDATTDIYSWTNNGTPIVNLQLPFDTEVPTYLSGPGVTSDYSGYSNNGVVNGPSWIQNGVIGGAYNFDGNDYIRVQESGNSLGGDGNWTAISVEFWIRAVGSTNRETVILKHDELYSTGGSSFGVGYGVDYRSYTSGYRVYWYIYTNTTLLSVDFQVNAGSGQWHHVVCTYESGLGLRLYTDGQLRNSFMTTGNITATVGGLLNIGGLGSASGDFVGSMDNVRIYPRALSAAQILQRYIETRDGLSTSETIVADETAIGDAWVCTVTPSNSWVGGTANTSTILYVVPLGNQNPTITWITPSDSSVSVNEGANLDLKQVSSDPDGDPLSYAWTLDSATVATTQNWTYTPGFTAQGIHTVMVTVSDGELSDYREWTVTVVDQLQTTIYDVEVDGILYQVALRSNSSISGYLFDRDNTMISFNVSAASGTVGLCDLTTSTALLTGPYTLLIDGTPVTPTQVSNATHTTLSFTYPQNLHQVEILGTSVIPEFPAILPMAMLLLAATVLTMYFKKKISPPLL